MKINNSKYDLSLNDTSNLRNLILENPELPLLIFAGEESWCGEWTYNQVDASEGKVVSLILYNDLWLDEDEYRDRLIDDLCDEDEYKDLSDDEYYKMIDEKIANSEFCNAIVIYVG